jgi:hypothetical protein
MTLFLIGLVLGACLGITAMAIVQQGRERDDRW